MVKYYVGVDIGGSNVRIVIADDVLRVKVTSKTVKKGPIDALGIQIAHLIMRGMKEIGISKEDLGGIGTSSAGPFVGGESLSTPNICGVENDWLLIPYIQTLKKYFGNHIPYELANDCVSAVKAEHLFGAGIGHNNCVYVTISTGVGSGIISDGVLLEGKGKNAGHFGHMIVKKDGHLCGCGQHGCIETIISGKSIARRAKEAGLKYNNSDDYSTLEVFEKFYDNDPIAEEIIKETIEYMGILFINIINATDTEILIVGGSVFMNHSNLLLPAVENYISENSMVSLSEGVQFATPELGKYVGDLAGLSLVLPDYRIAKWVDSKPWKDGFEVEISLETEESMHYSEE